MRKFCYFKQKPLNFNQLIKKSLQIDVHKIHTCQDIMKVLSLASQKQFFQHPRELNLNKYSYRKGQQNKDTNLLSQKSGSQIMETDIKIDINVLPIVILFI